jgi:uncharacterized membrane protein YuzA (DUF378 family)
MNILKYTAYVLTLIGALNWGLVGLFSFDLISAVFGEMTLITRILYTLVGISAIITALTIHGCDRVETKDSETYRKCSF